MANKYLEKLASPRWIKHLRDLNKNSPKLVEEAAQKILPHVPQKTREIANLGSGGSQIADLVVHPKGGAVVRKTPILRNWAPSTIRDAEARAYEQRDFWNHIGEVANRRGQEGQLAHLKGYEGPINYHQYSPPKKKEGGAAIWDKYLRLQNKKDSIGKSLREVPVGTPERSALSKEFHLAGQRTDTQYRHVHHLEPKLSPETNGILEEVKKSYPDLWDRRHANFVGNKIVDLEPVHSVHQTYKDIFGVTPVGAPKDLKGYSKRFFHGRLDQR
jgi:hypothetical protein